MRCAGTSCPPTSCAAAMPGSATRRSTTSPARCCCRSGTPTASSPSTRTPTDTGPGVRTDSTDPLDRYILAKTQRLVADTTARLDAYDLAGATTEVQGYLDALTNWYIRRSRERFWNAQGGPVDRDALDTLHTVLVTLTKVIAPLLPMVAEEIWQGLIGESSVHLQDWPGRRGASRRRRTGRGHGPPACRRHPGPGPARGARPAGSPPARQRHPGRDLRRLGDRAASSDTWPTNST